jgi:protein TonB
MPLYPQEMAKRKLHGKVIVLFVVDATGAVTDAHAMGKPNAELAALAVAAVSKWKFEPGRKRGQRVGYHMQVPIEF